MSAVIHYHDIGDYLSREEKLKIIDDFGDIAHIVEITKDPGRTGFYILHLGKRIK